MIVIPETLMGQYTNQQIFLGSNLIDELWRPTGREMSFQQTTVQENVSLLECPKPVQHTINLCGPIDERVLLNCYNSSR